MKTIPPNWRCATPDCPKWRQSRSRYCRACAVAANEDPRPLRERQTEQARMLYPSMFAPDPSTPVVYRTIGETTYQVVFDGARR